MSASQVLTNFLRKLLETGIVIDDGKEKVVITTADAYNKTAGLKKAKHLRLAAEPAEPVKKPTRKKSRGRRRSKGSALTPQRLLSLLEFHKEGITKASLAKVLGVSRPKLAAALQPLREKSKITEDALRYYPTVTDTEEQAAARRKRKTCIVPNCTKPHYAKGFCNNHYNISRREAAKSETNGARHVAAGVADTASYKQQILDALQDRSREFSLYELASLLDKKWQTLRKDIQELINENKVVKEGKKYVIAGQ